MKVDHISVSKFSAEQLAIEINKRTEGRVVHGIFFEPTSLLRGILEIRTTSIVDEFTEGIKFGKEMAIQEEKAALKSKYIGVHRDKSSQRWRASITVNKKRISIGRFDTEEEAAKAYDEYALKYRGFDTKTNFSWEICEFYNDSESKEIYFIKKEDVK